MIQFFENCFVTLPFLCAVKNFQTNVHKQPTVSIDGSTKPRNGMKHISNRHVAHSGKIRRESRPKSNISKSKRRITGINHSDITLS